MKSGFINLIALLESSKDPDIFESFKKINHLGEIRDDEIEGTIKICNNFLKTEIISSSKFSGYIFGAKYVGVVSEEFDILRFSSDTIINIELKSGNKPEREIKRQLVRHKFLLNSIHNSGDVRLFTYITDTEILYELIDDKLVPIDFKDLVNAIPTNFIESNLLSTLEDSSFIISPYSESERFFNSKYFLNNEQETARNVLINSDANYIALKGGPGTGKSLVLFDVATRLSQNSEKVLFVFCSALSTDLITTIDQKTIFKFIDIRKTRDLSDERLMEYDVLMIDESQRLYESQLKRFIKLFKNKKLILTVDRDQTLRPEEKKLDVEGIFERNAHKEEVEIVDCLSEKVRTDIELATFIQKFFDKSKSNLGVMNFPKVNVVYFENSRIASPFFKNCIDNEGFISLEVPEYIYSGELSKVFTESLDAFDVIGKEFDKVLLPLNSRVKYNSDKKLTVPVFKKYPYLAENSLFQILTRTKKELLILVINNKDLFLEIEKILTWKEFRDQSNISKRLKSLREVNHKTIDDLTAIVRNYKNIEESGVIPNRKISKDLANFYNVSRQFIEGEPSELRYSDFEIAYRNKTQKYTKIQKEELQTKLLEFLESYNI